MTQIEKKIFKALEDEAATLEEIAVLYRQADSASHQVFNRIDWRKLDSTVKRLRGSQGLDYVKRQSLKH